MNFAKTETTSYSSLPQSETAWQEHRPSGSRFRSVTKYGLLVVSYLTAALFGYVVALYASNPYIAVHTSDALELRLSPTTFQYNRSFSYPPSNHTNKAWREIFPKEGGFFIHPTIAPTRSTFSVFHQLHCLNGLRGAYFANQRAASEGRKLTDEDLPVDLQTSHMRHCIDFLRQNLMCRADTTLEVVDESIKGVHGFRTVHTCRDWEQLKEWTNEQQRRQHVPQIE